MFCYKGSVMLMNKFYEKLPENFKCLCKFRLGKKVHFCLITLLQCKTFACKNVKNDDDFN